MTIVPCIYPLVSGKITPTCSELPMLYPTCSELDRLKSLPDCYRRQFLPLKQSFRGILSDSGPKLPETRALSNSVFTLIVGVKVVTPSGFDLTVLLVFMVCAMFE